MKYLLLLISITLIFSCQPTNQDVKMIDGYASYGEEISPENALSQDEMMAKYNEMQIGDTATIKFASNVNAVCQMKGCWMKLELAPETEAMVKFKDYDFFVPKDVAESEAIVEGKAFIEEMSVEDQQHYAKDAGKTEQEIATITSPKTVYRFEADGVLLK